MKHLIILFAAVAFLCNTGCANKTKEAEPNAAEPALSDASETGPRWYYFSDTGIHPTKKPSEIPARTFVAWTEAVRVTDAAIIDKVPSLLINRLGLMTSAADDKPSALHTDSLFSANTAAAIYNTGEGTGIRVYRNSFFSPSGNVSGNGSATGGQANDICIALYKSETGTFSILLTPSDLELPPDAQCVALDRIGSMWYASFKYEKNSKVEFVYLEFESFPERKDGAMDLSLIKKISSETYRKSVAPFPFTDAPDTLKTILSNLPASTGFTLRVYSPLSKSAQIFVREGKPAAEDTAENNTAVDGTAFVSDEKTAVLFADGSFYYQSDNSLEKKQILQLPVLSNGYVYTNFILNGKSLLAAWEEQRFFETGRAGLLEITLQDGV